MNVVTNSVNKIESVRTVIEFGRFATLIMIVVTLIALIFIEPLEYLLIFYDVLPIILVGLALIISASLSIRGAHSRCENDFAATVFATRRTIYSTKIALTPSAIFIYIKYVLTYKRKQHTIFL